jgi:hypothetical protein
MKKRILAITFSLCVSIFLFESCSSGFLNKENTNEVNSQTYFKTVANATA